MNTRVGSEFASVFPKIAFCIFITLFIDEGLLPTVVTKDESFSRAEFEADSFVACFVGLCSLVRFFLTDRSTAESSSENVLL